MSLNLSNLDIIQHNPILQKSISHLLRSHLIKTVLLSNRLRTKTQQIHRPPIRLDDKEQMDHKAQFVVGVCAG